MILRHFVGRVALATVAVCVRPTAHAEEERPPELSAEEEQEFRALLAEANRLISERRTVVEGALRAFELLAGVLTERCPPPQEQALPAKPSVLFALPRGLLWLASRQGLDGKWAGDETATALSTMVFAPDYLREKSLQVAQLRVHVREITTTRIGERTLRELGLMSCEACALREHGIPRKSDRKKLQSMQKELLRRWSSTKECSGLELAWASAGLRALRESQATDPFDWPTREERPVTTGQITAEILRRRTLDDSDDSAVDALAERLLERLANEPQRTLDEWYLGACAVEGTDAEKRWNQAMVKAILHSQARDGGWSPHGAVRATHAQRVRATALAVLCLYLDYMP